MAVVSGPGLVVLGRGQPYLQAVQVEATGLDRFRCALDVGNRAAGGHPADIAGLHHLVRAKAVLMLQDAFKQVSKGGQADMGMLADIHAVTRCVAGRQHVVEKHKGPDAAAFTRGQGPQDRLAFYIFGARANHGESGHGHPSLSGLDALSITRSMGRWGYWLKAPSDNFVSIVTSAVVISLCTGHLSATRCSSSRWASVSTPLRVSLTLSLYLPFCSSALS